MQQSSLLRTPVAEAAQTIQVVSIDDMVSAEAERFAVNESHLSKTIGCESHGDPTAIGDHGKAYGVGQFHEDTFDWMQTQAIKQGEPFQNLQYKNPHDQITLMAWAFANGFEYNWSCFSIESNKGWV